MRTLIVIAGILFAACGRTPERGLAERLVGSWQQEISVLGRDKVSVLTFNQDGSFVENTYVKAMRGLLPEATLPGRWHVLGGEIHLEYLTGFTGYGAPEIEVRRVENLTEVELLSTDLRFGLQVERRRVGPQ